MSDSLIYTHEATVALLKQSQACAEAMEVGRKQPDHIFASKFTPVVPGPKLVQRQGETAPPENMDEHLPREMLAYRSRSHFGIPELQKSLDACLNARNITYEASANEPHFVCGTSIGNTLLPEILRVRRSGGLCAFGDKVLACVPDKDVLSRVEECGLNAVTIPGDRPVAAVIRTYLAAHPDARILLLPNHPDTTGRTLSEGDIADIAEVVRIHNAGRQRPLIVVADEARNDIRRPPGTNNAIPLASHPALREYTLSLNTLPGQSTDEGFA